MEIKDIYKKYDLLNDDVFQHKHYLIITRSGIEKVQAKEKINISYESIKCEADYCAVKATAKKINDPTIIVQTFGSAKYGSKVWDNSLKGGKGGWDEKGNTTSWYVMEIAEKRAMSRAVLKLTGFYELGVFGEDESEEFKKNTQPPTSKPVKEPFKKKALTAAIAKSEATRKVPLATMMKMYNMTGDQEQKYIKLIG